MFFNSIVFFVTTTLVWLFKREKDTQDSENHGIISTYMMLLKIAKLPAVQELVVILLTVRVRILFHWFTLEMVYPVN